VPKAEIVIDIGNQKVVVIVFAMGECPACEAYLPRLLAEAEQLKAHAYPFVVYVPGQTISPRAIPLVVYDAASPDPAIQALADRFEVSATPTTLVLMRGPGSFKVEGSLANNQISWLLNMANEANQ
jgi:thiol-disulfide isomerase/thioredoxin